MFSGPNVPLGKGERLISRGVLNGSDPPWGKETKEEQL